MRACSGRARSHRWLFPEALLAKPDRVDHARRVLVDLILTCKPKAQKTAELRSFRMARDTWALLWAPKISSTVEEESGRLDRVCEDAFNYRRSEPHAAFAAYTHCLQSLWI